MANYPSRGSSSHRRSRDHQGPRPERNFGNQPPPAPKPQLASALRLKNFRHLLEVAGEENLSLALDFSPHRVRELAEGLNFTDETTFHLETTLGLVGYLDQVNPRLSENELTRLKNPLGSTAPDVSRGEAPAVSSPASEPPVEASGAAEVPSAPSSAVAEASPPVGQSSEPSPAPSVQKEIPVAQAASKARTPAKKATRPVATSEATPPGTAALEKLREIRRLNLVLVTRAPGAKSKLAAMVGLTPAGISHRLHGHQHVDDGDAEQFAKALRLPSGWFDAPRSEADLPSSVLGKLASDRPVSAGRPPNIPTETPRIRKRSRAGTTTQVLSPQGEVVSTTTAQGELTPAMQMPSADAVPSLKNALPAAAPLSAPPPRREPVAPIAQSTSAPAAATLRMESPIENDFEELGPVAVALVKTIAMKARQGRLTEERALKILTEAMAL